MEQEESGRKGREGHLRFLPGLTPFESSSLWVQGQGHMSVTKYRHSRVVRLWLTGNVVACSSVVADNTNNDDNPKEHRDVLTGKSYSLW